VLGGTVVCCRNTTAEAIYNAIADEGETHFGGAPIVLNMIVNAKDALLESDNTPKNIVVDIAEEGEIVIISISDNAAGIPEEILENIFDPYFSTKDEKNGTGLGLYMANVILTELMKSDITVQSTNHGTTFTIRLKKSTQ